MKPLHLFDKNADRASEIWREEDGTVKMHVEDHTTAPTQNSFIYFPAAISKEFKNFLGSGETTYLYRYDGTCYVKGNTILAKQEQNGTLHLCVIDLSCATIQAALIVLTEEQVGELREFLDYDEPSDLSGDDEPVEYSV